MIYINSAYVPSSYKYLVSYSDNYIVLSNVSHVDASYEYPDDLDLYVQYFSPSTTAFKTTRTFYNTSYFTNIKNDISYDYKNSADFPLLLITSLIIVFCLTFIFNGLTRLVSKGGIVFPH